MGGEVRGSRFQVVSWELGVAGYALWVAGWGLRVAGGGLPTRNR
jgi:hypothetical protein